VIFTVSFKISPQLAP